MPSFNSAKASPAVFAPTPTSPSTITMLTVIRLDPPQDTVAPRGLGHADVDAVPVPVRVVLRPSPFALAKMHNRGERDLGLGRAAARTEREREGRGVGTLGSVAATWPVSRNVESRSTSLDCRGSLAATRFRWILLASAKSLVVGLVVRELCDGRSSHVRLIFGGGETAEQGEGIVGRGLVVPLREERGRGCGDGDAIMLIRDDAPWLGQEAIVSSSREVGEVESTDR